MNDVSIREATPDDFFAIQRLNHALFTNEYARDPHLHTPWPYEETGERFLRRMIENENALCLIAETQTDIIGYLIGTLLPIESARPVKRSELVNIFIEEGFRNMGIGGEMTKQFLDWSKRMGATHAVVGSQAENTEAIAFYERQGFHPYHLRLEKKIR